MSECKARGSTMQGPNPARRNPSSDAIRGKGRGMQPKKTAVRERGLDSATPTPSTGPLIRTSSPSGETGGPSLVLSNGSLNIASDSVNASLEIRPQVRGRQFTAFGIAAYPTVALKREICIDFIMSERYCSHGNHCFRIHPLDKRSFCKKLRDRDSLFLFKSGLTDDPILPLSDGEQDHRPQQATILSTTLSLTDKQQTLENRKPPTCNPGWDPATGIWNFGLDQDVWLAVDCSSSETSEELSPKRQIFTSQHLSDTEDDRKVGKAASSSHPRPMTQPELCRNYQRGTCTLGFSCGYTHQSPSLVAQEKQSPVRLSNQGLDASTAPIRHNGLPPRVQREDCTQWLKGQCWRGKACRYRHPDIQSQALRPPDESRGEMASRPPRYPRPPFDTVCKNWLRGECLRGYDCNNVHEDLTYDDSIPQRKLVQVPARTEPEIFSTVIYKHIKIKLTDGCEVVEVITGFETSWIYLVNVPRHVQECDLENLLKTHGDLLYLRIPEKGVSPFMTVKARFVSAAEASRVCSILDGLEVFNSTLTARLSISVNAEASTHLNDTSVRVSWEAPSKTGYAGFSTPKASLDALEKCRYVSFGKHLLKASAHTGLPAVGRFNIRLGGVPADADSNEIKEFLGADGMMWGKPNYTPGIQALNGIQRMLKESGVDLLDFEIMPPPYKSGMMVGWAHLATPAQGKTLCDYMHGRKPFFTGHTRIFAQHIHSLEYSLTSEVYEGARRDIDALAASAWRMGHLNVSCRPHPTCVIVRLGAEDTQGLSKLKAELDIILSGEVVREKGKVVWDRFFARLPGLEFIAQLERQHAPLTIRVDKYRNMIRLFGTSTERLAVRMKITEKMEMLRRQNVYTIELDARMMGVFMNEGMAQLVEELGEDCVHLDLWTRALSVRGDQHAFNAAKDAVVRAGRAHCVQRPGIISCPVCFDAASVPISLCCGHAWCRTCIVRYMMTAIEQKFFPLRCLGDDAKCQERIPLSCAKQLLPPADFDALIEASFLGHVHRHQDEFCYCPTPDCQQIYRRMPRVEIPKGEQQQQPTKKCSSASTGSVKTTLQCPSCLVRICASCQTEAHDGLVCVRSDEGDGLFEEWMKNNDVKPCPGCKMPIEKAMGCHHVTCTVCSIHMCWVCLTPFHNGAGVYSHMLAIHGSFV